MKKIIHKQKGFTLIEVIVTIIIAALAGMIIFTYLGNVLARSHEPIGDVRNLGESVEVMEEIAANYLEYLRVNIPWSGEADAFIDTLPTEGVTAVNRRGQTGDFSAVIFDVLEITITRGNQTVSAIFPQ